MESQGCENNQRGKFINLCLVEGGHTKDNRIVKVEISQCFQQNISMYFQGGIRALSREMGCQTQTLRGQRCQEVSRLLTINIYNIAHSYCVRYQDILSTNISSLKSIMFSFVSMFNFIRGE